MEAQTMQIKMRLAAVLALVLFSPPFECMSMNQLRVPVGSVGLPFPGHGQQPAQPLPALNLRPPIVSLPSDSSLLNVSTTYLLSPHVESPTPSRSKHPLQDKLQSAQQSLNDLFSDLVSKPLGLSQIANGSLLSFEQLLSEKVKLPRPLNALIATLAQTGNGGNAGAGEETNELPTSENSSRNGGGNGKLSAKKKKNTALANLVGRCYKPYGCFRINEPFLSIYRPINLIPEPPAALKVSFHLRTRANPSIAERLPYSESSRMLKSTFFQPENALKIIVHGYLESSEESWIKEMSAALLNRDQFNVICVDWMLGASPPYTQAVANTRIIGAIIAHLIAVIQDTYPGRYPASKIHIIGHSLGSHIAGYTGHIIGDLGHITGLDPAEPYFQYTHPHVRLDPSDANFVDVVHTDVSSIMSGGFGMNQTCGHVDFYPNGGINQPGCNEAPIRNVWDSINKERTVFDGLRRFIGCNHLRSFQLYIEAINSECPFLAYPCVNYDDFSSGQCTGHLLEQQYERHCFQDPFQQQSSSTHLTANLSACPIRLGLDSGLDYRRQLQLLGADSDHRAAGLVYFLQTADRAPFCHYHYDLTALLRVSLHRYVRNFRSRQFTIGDNAVLLNGGRLYVTVVGTKGRVVAELSFKQTTDNAGSGSADTAEGNDRISGSAVNELPLQLKEQNILFSETDLGDILRLELYWRPYNPPMQRPLMQMQSRAFRRWLPQLSTLEMSIPSVLNELQRTLNVNASQVVQAHASHLLSWSSQLPEILQPKGHQPELMSNSLTGETPNQQTWSAKEAMPLLEALMITKLETGEQYVFCADEPAMRMLFQSKPFSKTGILIKGQKVDQANKLEHLSSEHEDLIMQLCIRDIL